MAQADNPKGFYPADPNVRVRWYPIAASQTLARGDAVILSSNQVAIALAGSARILGVVAQACASLDAATMVPVWVAEGHTTFIGRQDSTDALSVGDEIDLVGATGAMQLDSDASTTDVFRLVEEVDTSETDAAGKRWKVLINKPELGAID